jgi:hypothetical protein
MNEDQMSDLPKHRSRAGLWWGVALLALATLWEACTFILLVAEWPPELIDQMMIWGRIMAVMAALMGAVGIALMIRSPLVNGPVKAIGVAALTISIALLALFVFLWIVLIAEHGPTEAVRHGFTLWPGNVIGFVLLALIIFFGRGGLMLLANESQPALVPPKPVALGVVLGVVSLLSLILGVVGVALAVAAAFWAFTISVSDHHQRLLTAEMLWYGYGAAAALAVAVLLRLGLWKENAWCNDRP